MWPESAGWLRNPPSSPVAAVLLLHPLQMVTPGRKRQGAHQATGQPELDSGPGFPTPQARLPEALCFPISKVGLLHDVFQLCYITVTLGAWK